MKKIRVKFLKDDDVGIKKGETRTLAPDLAKRLINNKVAKFVEEVIVPSKGSDTSAKELSARITELENRVKELETVKPAKPAKPVEPLKK